MNLVEAKVLAEDFLNKYNLNHGNAYVEIAYGNLYVLFEARRHTVMNDLIDREEIEECEDANEFEELMKVSFKNRLDEFDVDEEFNMLWSTEFGEHNGFTARSFMELLDQDFEFFEDVEDSF